MSSPTSFGSLLPSVLREVRRRILSLTIAFTVLALIGLVVGMMIPKTWECGALLVPDSTSIKALIDRSGGGGGEGRLSPIAQMVQAVQTRKISHEVLEFGGWLNAHTSAQDEERLRLRLKSRLRVENARDMIRVIYRDNDAKRAFHITTKMVEILIREAANAKETASREAYEFIERQVKDYGGELALVHDKLLAYYRSQGALVPPPVGLPVENVPERQEAHAGHASRISTEDVARLRAEESTLMAQLSRARRPPSNQADSQRTEEQLRARIEQMRLEHAHLVNTYTENHPDVVRKAKDLEAARQDLRQLETARIENENLKNATASLDDQVANAASLRLEQVRAQLSAAGAKPRVSSRSQRSRHGGTPAAPNDPNKVDPEMRHVGQDSKLSELLRRYETTRDVYQDLLKKRESARLALNLDVERGNVVLKVQEPPMMPVIPTGLRVMHKSVIALVVAIAIPLGLLVAMVTLDGRVRSSDQIERLARVPLLVAIPYAPSGDVRGRARLHRRLVAFMILFVLVTYMFAYFLSQTRIVK